jgi:hypothetical protein
MISKRITAADLAGVTGYTRHKLRAFMKELPGFEHAGPERVAREYARHDMLIVAICCALETRCGLRRDTIAALATDIRRAVTGPRPVAARAWLFVRFEPLRAECVSAPAAIHEGVMLPLESIFRRVDAYLGSGQETASGGQFYLDLGPVPVYGSARGRLSTKRGA